MKFLHETDRRFIWPFVFNNNYLSKYNLNLYLLITTTELQQGQSGKHATICECSFHSLLFQQNKPQASLVSSRRWCKFYQRIASNKTNDDEKDPGLPKNIINTVRPVYLQLCDKKLLEKCLHGRTQKAKALPTLCGL